MSREAQNPVDLDDLYRDVILDHYRSPRNRGLLDDPTVSAEGFNPSCGDEIQLSVAIIDNVVGGLGFGGSGCSISQSSASMMTEAMTGRDLDSAREMSKHVQQMLTDDDVRPRRRRPRRPRSALRRGQVPRADQVRAARLEGARPGARQRDRRSAQRRQRHSHPRDQ